MVIFSYTGSPQVKISQKVFGGYFFDSHCRYTSWFTVRSKFHISKCLLHRMVERC